MYELSLTEHVMMSSDQRSSLWHPTNLLGKQCYTNNSTRTSIRSTTSLQYADIPDTGKFPGGPIKFQEISSISRSCRHPELVAKFVNRCNNGTRQFQSTQVVCDDGCHNVFPGVSDWFKPMTRPILFLPRDAMLARYMLSSCVRLSVCHKSEFVKDGETQDHKNNLLLLGISCHHYIMSFILCTAQSPLHTRHQTFGIESNKKIDTQAWHVLTESKLIPWITQHH